MPVAPPGEEADKEARLVGTRSGREEPMISTIVAALLLANAPAGIKVDVGRVNLVTLPPLRRSQRALPTSAMVGEVEAMLRSGTCRLPGQRSTRFDIDVPYAVLVEPDGTASRVVVGELGCAELESYVGLVILELARLGDFAETGEKKAKWYGSKLNFNLH